MLDDLLDVLGLDLGTARGERLHESGVGDDAEGAQGAAGSLVLEGECVLGCGFRKFCRLISGNSSRLVKAIVSVFGGKQCGRERPPFGA